MQARSPKQTQFVLSEACGQIRRGLDAPLESRAHMNQSLGNFQRSIDIDEEVVIYDPEHFQAVPSREVKCFLDHLLGRKTIPLASIDSSIRAVRTVERASKARYVHCPSTAAQACVRVEVREVIRLRW